MISILIGLAVLLLLLIIPTTIGALLYICIEGYKEFDWEQLPMYTYFVWMAILLLLISYLLGYIVMHLIAHYL